MCLIEIIFTKKTSETKNIKFLYSKFVKFFTNSKISEIGMRGGKYYVRIYVHFPENYVSFMCQNKLSSHSKIDQAFIVS